MVLTGQLLVWDPGRRKYDYVTAWNEAGVTFAEASHLFHLGLESKHRGRNVY